MAVYSVCGVLRMRCGAAVARGVGAAWRVWCGACGVMQLCCCFYFFFVHFLEFLL